MSVSPSETRHTRRLYGPAAMKIRSVKLAASLTTAVAITDLVLLATGLPVPAVTAATVIVCLVIAVAAAQVYITHRLAARRR